MHVLHPSALSVEPTASRDGFSELRKRIFARVLERMLKVRRMIAPGLACFALWICWVDTTTWRRGLLLGVAAVLLASVVLDTMIARKLEANELDESPLLVPNVLLIGTLQQLMFFATGGVASPFMPLLLPAASSRAC